VSDAFRQMATHVGDHARAGDAADSRAHQLNREHERRREQDGPEQAIAEARPRLRVSGDAGRVVVRRAGDEAGSQKPQRAAQKGFAFHREVSLALFGRKFGDSVPLEKAATRFQQRNALAKLHKGDKAR
jgi:hypothetical protein